MTDKVPCLECGKEFHNLYTHLTDTHQMSIPEYLGKYPNAHTISERLAGRARLYLDPDRARAAVAGTCQVDLAGISFDVNLDVPADACLPYPKDYVLPTQGKMSKTIKHGLVGFKSHRSMWVYGPTGSGKDAMFHFLSSLLRIPAEFIEIRPGEDISALLSARGFQNGSTVWEDGRILRAIRDGYVIKDREGKEIRRVPYLILISDIDRATPEQLEMLRPILDSIEGRVCKPDGSVDRVFPGTRFVATANTAGSGERTVLYVTAQTQDVSILNRFDQFLKFEYPDWSVWAQAIRDRYSNLLGQNPNLIDLLGQFVKALHNGGGKTMNPFSYRDVRSCLDHIEDTLRHQPTLWDPKDPALIFLGLRSWFSRLSPDGQSAALALASIHMKIGSKPIQVPKDLEDFP